MTLSLRMKMLDRAAELVRDVDDLRRKVEAHDPARLPLVQVAIDDTVRVYFLIESSQLRAADMHEIVERLQRAIAISESLGRRPN